jgi:gas vesicle protein
LIKKIALIACILAVPTLTVAFAPTKGNNNKNYRDLIEVIARKKAQQWKKEIKDFFASMILHNQIKK